MEYLMLYICTVITAIIIVVIRCILLIIFTTIPKIGLTFHPLELFIHHFHFNHTCLKFLQSFYSIYFPVDLRGFQINTLSIRMSFHHPYYMSIAIHSLQIEGQLTHVDDWENNTHAFQSDIIQLALQTKHKTANDFTNIMNNAVENEEKTSFIALLMDGVLRSLHVDIKRFEIRISDTREEFSIGLVLKDLHLIPSDESLVSIKPRHCQISFLGLYINPPHTDQHTRNYMLCIQNISLIINIPDIFSILFQSSFNKSIESKSISIEGNANHVEVFFLAQQMHLLLFRALAIFGVNEWLDWKARGCQMLSDTEIKLTMNDIMKLAPLYKTIFLNFYHMNSNANNYSDIQRESIIDRLLGIEATLTLGDIMHLRRLCFEWKLSPIDGPAEAQLIFSTDDPLNLILSRTIHNRRLVFDQAKCYISSFSISCSINQLKAIFFVPNTDKHNYYSSALPSFNGQEKYIYSADDATFISMYRMFADSNDQWDKFRVSMNFNGMQVTDVDGFCLYLLETAIKSTQEGEASNLFVEYSFPDIGTNRFRIDINNAILPIFGAPQLLSFFYTIYSCLVLPKDVQISTSASSDLCHELNLGGRNVSLSIHYSKLYLILSLGSNKILDQYILLEINGHLTAESRKDPLVEFINIDLHQAYVKRNTYVTALYDDTMKNKWTNAINTSKPSKYPLVVVYNTRINLLLSIAEKSIADDDLTWTEADLVDQIKAEGMLRVNVTVNSLRLIRQILSALPTEYVNIRLIIDDSEDCSESHPFNVNADDGCSYELLVPGHCDSHDLTMIVTSTDGIEIGSCSFPIGCKIHNCGVNIYNDIDCVGRLEIKGDIGLPLLKLSIKTLKVYRHMLLNQEGKHSFESMHFVVSSPLPPDCSSSLTLCSTSFPCDMEAFLRERFLIPCRPGVYFPITISLYLEGKDSDIRIASTGSVIFNGNSVDCLSVLKDEEMDVAEILFDFEWYTAAATDADIETSVLDGDAVGTADDASGTLKLPSERSAVVASTRRIKRAADIGFGNVDVRVNHDDLVLLLSGLNSFPMIRSSSPSKPRIRAAVLECNPSVISYEGSIIPQCKDYVWESKSTRRILGHHYSVASFLASNPCSIALENFWETLEDNGIMLREVRYGNFSQSKIHEVQVQFVKCFHNYLFAKSVWGLVVVPHLLYLPRIGNIKAKSGKLYQQMESPVGVGSLVFVDNSTVVTSMDPWLRNQRLTGIMTSKADCISRESKFLQFELDRPSVVYFCWDMRCNTKPKWIEKQGFVLTGISVQTTVSSHIIFFKSYSKNLLITLGGCAMSQSAYDNYFILIGPRLLEAGDMYYIKSDLLHWKLKPSSELRTQALSPSKRSRTLYNTSGLVSSITRKFSVTSISFHGTVFSFSLVDQTKTDTLICIRLSSFDFEGKVIKTHNQEFPKLVSRGEGFDVTMACSLNVQCSRNQELVYIIEPLQFGLGWNKISGDLNHCVNGNFETIVINMFPELLKIYREINHVFKNVQEIFAESCCSKSEFGEPTHKLPSQFFKKSSDSELARIDSFYRENKRVKLYNELGVEVKLWITGAGFDDTCESYVYTNIPEDTDEELNSVRYSHQTVVYAGGEVEILFNDPLAPIEYFDKSLDRLLLNVLMDCEIEAWNDVQLIRLVRDSILSYPLSPIQHTAISPDHEKVLNTSASSAHRAWTDLSHNIINPVEASPLARWRDGNNDEFASIVAKTVSSEASSSQKSVVDDIFFIDYNKKEYSPYALRVECKSSQGAGGSDMAIRFSSNFKFLNNSGAQLHMLHRENIRFTDEIVELESGCVWYLPLSVLNEQMVRFRCLPSAGFDNIVKIPLNREMLDVKIPQAFRRSFETDCLSIRLFPEKDGLESEVTSSTLDKRSTLSTSSWVLELHPALTICNATSSAIEVQILQPPYATLSTHADAMFSDARSLFFLPDEYYTRSGAGTDWDVDLKPQEAGGYIPDFTKDSLLRQSIIPSGEEIVLPFIQTDRTLYYRMRFPTISSWSITYLIDKRLYGLKARFDKHKAEPVVWEEYNPALPNIFLKKIWNDSYPSRRIEFFCTFIVINKTGMLLRYDCSASPSEIDSNEYETSDELQINLFKDIGVPIMLDCPSNIVRVLPYAMNEDLGKDLFYVYWPACPYPKYRKCRTIRGLQSPSEIYIDSDEIVTSWPKCFENVLNMSSSILIQTSIDDSDTLLVNDYFLSFVVSTDSFVYICFDSQSPHVPIWMSQLGFVSVGDRVRTSSRSFQIFRKQYRAFSPVRLGSTKVEKASNRFKSSIISSMFFVIVVKCELHHLEPCVTHPISATKCFFYISPNFRTGSILYADDAEQAAVEIPKFMTYSGLTLLKTFQKNKFYAYDLEFYLQQDSIVYVCFDFRMKVFPTWLDRDDFVNTSLSLRGVDTSYFIFKRNYKSGKVLLGSIQLPDSNLHNYFVLIASQTVPDSTTNVPVANPSALNESREFWNPIHGPVQIISPDLDILDRTWSKQLNLTASNKGEVLASGCALSVRVQSLLGVFHRCRAVTLLPRFVLINNLKYAIVIVPYSSEDPHEFPSLNFITSRKLLVAGESSYVLYDFCSISRSCYPQCAESPFIIIQSENAVHCASRSVPICVNMVGEQFTWTSHHQGGRGSIISSTVKAEGTVFSIILSEGQDRYPFKLENRSQVDIQIRQAALNCEWMELPSMMWTAFLWQRPFEEEKRLEIRLSMATQKEIQVNLSNVGIVGSLVWTEHDFEGLGEEAQTCCLGFEVIVELSTRVLKIFEKSNSAIKQDEVTQESRGNQGYLHPLKCLHIRLSMNGAYIRISNEVNILGISIENILLDIIGEKCFIDLIVDHVQIDDLADKPKFFVVFAPSCSGRNSHLIGSILRKISFFHAHCEWAPGEHAIAQIKLFDVCVREISLKICMDLVIRIVAAIGRTAGLRAKAYNEKLTARVAEMQAVKAVLSQTISDRIFKDSSSLENIYFYMRQFHHNRFVINLEIFVGSKLSHINFDVMDKSIATGFAVLGGPLVSFVSSIVGSIAHVSPVFVFDAFLLSDFFGEIQSFSHMIYTVWNQQAFAQAYKIFGSLELIGNPLSFIDNVSTGMSDFYSRTKDEVEGVSTTRGEGVRRLAYSVIVGTFGTASRVAGSLANVSRIISGSKGTSSYERIDSPETFTDGLQQGGGAIVRSVAKGLSGLVNEPKWGMEKDGVFGVFKGLGKGVVRLFASPLTGTLDAVSLVAVSIEKGTKSINGKPVGRILREERRVEEENISAVLSSV